MKKGKKGMDCCCGEDCDCESCCCSSGMKGYTKSCGGMFYGLGFIGAAIYNISVASGFWGIVLAILKAAVWPAYLVYKLFSYIGI